MPRSVGARALAPECRSAHAARAALAARGASGRFEFDGGGSDVPVASRRARRRPAAVVRRRADVLAPELARRVGDEHDAANRPVSHARAPAHVVLREDAAVRDTREDDARAAAREVRHRAVEPIEQFQ
eukprot:205417-Prymnesium_polylepis.1